MTDLNHYAKRFCYDYVIQRRLCWLKEWITAAKILSVEDRTVSLEPTCAVRIQYYLHSFLSVVVVEGLKARLASSLAGSDSGSERVLAEELIDVMVPPMSVKMCARHRFLKIFYHSLSLRWSYYSLWEFCFDFLALFIVE